MRTPLIYLMSISLFVAGTFAAPAAEAGGGGATKIDVCHWSADEGVFVEISVSANSAHLKHAHDVLVGAYYPDADGDGYGDGASKAGRCPASLTDVANSSDCDDGDGGVNPGASELMGNGVDDDCNPATADALTYWNAAEDYTGSNPSGDWSYGYNWLGRWGQAFWGLLGAHGVTGDLDWWSLNSFFNGMVYKNTSETTTFGNCADWCLQPGTLAMHPPGAGGFVPYVRWTAPAAGVYEVEVTFSPIDAQSNLINVYVGVAGALVHAGQLTTLGTSSSHSATYSLQAGATVDFVVERAGTWVNDGTDLNATITLLQ